MDTKLCSIHSRSIKQFAYIYIISSSLILLVSLLEADSTYSIFNKIIFLVLGLLLLVKKAERKVFKLLRVLFRILVVIIVLGLLHELFNIFSEGKVYVLSFNSFETKVGLSLNQMLSHWLTHCVLAFSVLSVEWVLYHNAGKAYDYFKKDIENDKIEQYSS